MLKETSVENLDFNPVKKIGKEWMTITASKGKKANAMTASWGGIGVLWNLPVTTIYIRSVRYTKEFVDGSDFYSLCFFDGERKKEMEYLGTVSGRDVDKIAKSGLTLNYIDGVPYFKEAKIVFICHKLFAHEIKENEFTDKTVYESIYGKGAAIHTIYIGSIIKTYIND